MWRLKRIELENFRSYSGVHRVDLDGVNVFWGRIGAGKSSVLYAIEYALFGRQLEVKERVAKLVDLIHVDAHEMRVAVELHDGDRRLRVERKMSRRGSEKLAVVYNGEEVRGKNAEERLAELLGVDEDLYERLVYISHKTLEGFIYGTPQRRSVSVDKLFGIDVIDGVLRAISPVEKALLNMAEELRKRLAAYEKYKDVIKRYGGYSKLTSRLEALRAELEALRRREEALSREVEELAKKRAEYLDRVRGLEGLFVEYYRAKSELELLGAEEELGGEAAAKIRDALRQAVEEFEHMLDPKLVEKLAGAGDIESLASTMSEVYDALVSLEKELESQMAESVRLYEQSLQRVKKIEAEVAEVESRAKRLEKSYQRFKELQREFSSLEAAKSALAELRRRLENSERAVAFYTALKTVATYASEANLDVCPVCGASLSRERVVQTLESIGAKYGELIREVENLRDQLRKVEKAVDEMDMLSSEVAEYLSLKARLEELILEREEAVKRALQAEKAVKQLEKRLQKLRELLARVDKRAISDAVSKYWRALRARELRRKLRELEEELRRANVTNEIVSLEMRWREVTEELERISPKFAELNKERNLLEEVVNAVGGDLEVLRKKLDNALYAYGKLQDIKSRMELVKINARARLLEAARNRFNEIFLELYKYGDLVGVGADLEQRKGYYNFYAVSPGGERYNIARLSDGQRLSIALSLALALRDLSQIKLGFLIFDEPIPYVDVNVRGAFVEFLESLSHRYQILLATQSEEFAREVGNRITGAKLYHVVKERTSKIEEP